MIFSATEFGLTIFRAPLQPRHTSFHLLSIAGAAAFWLLMNKLANAFRSMPRLGWVVATCIGFFCATLLVATSMTYYKFGQFINADMAGFIWNDPRYFVDFIISLLVGWLLPIYLAAVVAMSLIWRPRRVDPDAPPRRTRLWILVTRRVLLAIFMIAALVIVGINSKSYHHRIESTYLWALPQSIVETFTDKIRLHAAVKADIADLDAAQQPPWNVLFIYNESVANESVFEDPSVSDKPFQTGLPQLADWLEAERERSVIFKRAFTNSSATDVSIPSLLTGVAPYAPVETLHNAPLLWHWAHAAGLRSVLVTSQRYSWASFDAFFFSSAPDIYQTASTLDAPIVNDTGIDDMLAAQALVDELEAIPEEQPVMAILGTNAAHYPFQSDSPFVEIPDDLTRHERSLRIVDHAIARVLDSLQKSGRLERTIVVMTSDHGALVEPRHAPRIFSFYDEIGRVPMFVRLPQPLIDARPEALRALRANQDQLVQNIDLVPTLVSLLGLDTSPENKKIMQQLTGQSLLSPAPDDRALIMLNTNDIRTWHTEGFGIFLDQDLRFVFTNIDGPKLFNANDDPEQMHDLWPQADARVRKRILKIVASNRHLTRIYDARKNPD